MSTWSGIINYDIFFYRVVDNFYGIKGHNQLICQSELLNKCGVGPINTVNPLQPGQHYRDPLNTECASPI